MQALRRGDIETFLTFDLLNARLDWKGNTALHVLAVRGNAAGVKALIAAGADPSKRNDDGRTPYFIAAWAQRRECMNALRTDVNATDINGCTPLHIAASLGRCDMVHALVYDGCNIHIKDNNGRTALMVARNREVVEYLEQRSEYLQGIYDGKF